MSDKPAGASRISNVESHDRTAYCASPELDRNPSLGQLRSRNSLGFHYGRLTPTGHGSPQSFTDFKVVTYRSSPEGRLKLVNFLQDVQLDHLLNVLPDDCTFDTLCNAPESLRSTLARSLKPEEFGVLQDALRRYSAPSTFSDRPVSGRRHSDWVSLTRGHVKGVGEVSSSSRRPLLGTPSDVRHIRSGGRSPVPTEVFLQHTDDSPRTPTIFRGANFAGSRTGSYHSFYKTSSRLNPATGLSSDIHRTSSLGAFDSRLSAHGGRPSSVSESAGTVDHSMYAAPPSPTSSAFHAFATDLTSSDRSRSPRKPSLRRPLSQKSDAQSSSGRHGNTSSSSSVNILMQSSHAAGVHRASTLLRQSSQMSPSIAFHTSFYGAPFGASHPTTSNLLRMKRNTVSLSAPNLLSLWREQTGSVIHPTGSMTDAFSHDVSSDYFGLPGSTVSTDAYSTVPSESAQRTLQKTSHGALHVSTSLACTPSSAEAVTSTVRSRPPLRYPAQNRTIFLSGLGSDSGSSSYMADRSLSSPTHSPGLDSLLSAYLANTSAHSNSYFGSPHPDSAWAHTETESPKPHSGKTLKSTGPSRHLSNEHPGSASEDLGHSSTSPDVSILPPFFQNKAGESKQTGPRRPSNQNQPASTADKRMTSLRLRPDNRLISENRRWSLTSLPSSGYGTNTPESGSYISRSRCSSRELLCQSHTSQAPTALYSTSPLNVLPGSGSKTIKVESTKPDPRPTSSGAASTSPALTASDNLSASSRRLVPPMVVAKHKGEEKGDGPTDQRSSTDLTLMPETDRSPIPRMPSPLCSNFELSSSGTRSLSVTQPCSPCISQKNPFDRSGCGSFSPINLMAGTKARSRSLSPLRCSGSGEQDILLLNDVYRERFPKASAQMQERLQCLIDELEKEDTVAWSAVARFVHRQVVQHAKDCLQKALSRIVTCRYFYEMTENLEKLVEDTRVREPDSVPVVVALVRRLLLIIARPARLLECLEFDPREFYQMLEVAEDQARRQASSFGSLDVHARARGEIVSADVPLYIISKLGLNKNVLQESYQQQAANLHNRGLSLVMSSEVGVRPETPARARFLSGSDSSPSIDYTLPTKPITPTRLPCEADFEIIKLVSNGAYGAVYLVRHRVTRQRFAMKKIGKQHLKLRNQVEQVFAERDIMSFADNPFVVSLCCTFETKKCLCMVMEYVEGGDCANLLKQIGGPLPLDLARLYFAETVLALEYLHNYGIVHRDLKPDNLLITHEGHIKLTDFGLSRIGLMNLATNLIEKNLDLDKDCKMFRDKQVFGTPEYIAPEVILRQGYGKPVDWWSMGIILYEFLVGCVPFYGDSIEDLFSEIVTAPIEWPEEEEWRVPDEAVEIISQLLERDPLLRLGTACGAIEIKEAAFFAGPPPIDWNNLLRLKAAFVPQLEHDEDTSYFDPRNERYQHDVDSDEDISYSPRSTSQSGRSSPLQASSTSTRASSTSVIATDQPSIRRPAASRLSREKQLSHDRRRCHSLNDAAGLVPQATRNSLRASLAHKSASGKTPSVSKSLSSRNSNASPTELRDGDLATTTLTAESVESRTALHMLQNLSLDVNTPVSKTDRCLQFQGTCPTTAVSKTDSSVLPLLGGESDSEEESDKKRDPEVAFHSFASYSPRFSVVLEQARMNEAADTDVTQHPLAVSSTGISDAQEHPWNRRSTVSEPPRTSRSQSSLIQQSLKDTRSVTTPLNPKFTDRATSPLILEDTTPYGVVHVAKGTDRSMNFDMNPPEHVKQPAAEIHTPIKHAEPSLKPSGSNSSLELSQHGSTSWHSSCSSSDLEPSTQWTKQPHIQQDAQPGESFFTPVTTVTTVEPASDRNSITSTTSDTTSSSSSSLSLTMLTPQPPTPQAAFFPPSCTLETPPTPIPSMAPQTSWLRTSDEGNTASDAPLKLSEPVRIDSRRRFSKPSTKHDGPTVSQSGKLAQIPPKPPTLVLTSDRDSLIHSQRTEARSPLASSANSTSPSYRSSNSITIHRGKSGFGFTIRAIRVYFGTSCRYTLHHLVHSVDRNGPAWRAGLHEGDLIMCVNDIAVPGMVHTQVVKLILKSGPQLRLTTTPLDQSFIRSDGPWRPSGKLVPRATPSSSHSKHPVRHSNRKSPTRLSGVMKHSNQSSHTQPSQPRSSGSNEEQPGHFVRRPTVRETRYRNVAVESSVDSGTSMLSGSSSMSVSPVSGSIGSGDKTSHAAIPCGTASLNKPGTQIYSSIMSQRFGFPVAQPLSSHGACSPAASNHPPTHRRSIEKPLLRQLSERQHRAMLAAQTTSSAAPVHSVPSNLQHHGVPHYIAASQPHATPRPTDTGPFCGYYHQSTPPPSSTGSPSLSTTSSLGCFSGGDSSSSSSPGSASPKQPLIGHPAALHHSFTAAGSPWGGSYPYQPAPVSPHSPATGTHPLHFGLAPVPRPLHQPVPPNISTTPPAIRLRHSDPVRQPVPQATATPLGYPTAAQNVVPPDASVVLHPSVTQPSEKLSPEVSALVSSGQVRLRRRSHMFAVQHVEPPDSGSQPTTDHSSTSQNRKPNQSNV